ncbi:MAG: SGNH/GDSL hydrolase family protein [Planctomycetota bacterium]
MKRRHFLTTAASASATVCLSPSPVFAAEKMTLSKGDVILFQGDSITDAGRKRKPATANKELGRGYPNMIAKGLLDDYANLNLQIHNRGISGNKVPDLDERWQADCIDLQPRLLSILIGVNDLWHRLNGRYDGTAETYRDGFADLIERTRAALPKTKIVIGEPFVLMAGTVKENKEKWSGEFDLRRQYAAQVARDADAVWVPFQTMFNEAVASGTKPEKLAADGVHPTPKGHQMMAKTWRTIVGV